MIIIDACHLLTLMLFSCNALSISCTASCGSARKAAVVTECRTWDGALRSANSQKEGCHLVRLLAEIF